MTTLTSNPTPTVRPRAVPPAPWAARQALRLLRCLQHGVLHISLPDGNTLSVGLGANQLAPAYLQVHDWAMFDATLRAGDIGFAEAYIEGHWTTPDLSALLRLLAANRQALDRVLFGSWWGRLAYRLRHLRHHNSRANSRKNIHAHYDLGNAFYRLWLDETMNYSAAWFQGQTTGNLVQAQHAKVARALDEARVGSGDRVLEIGCGWGALAEKACLERGASLVGVTLSTEQLAYANERLQRQGIPAGPGAQADLRLQDYRDIPDAPFDAICSIEMVEAVGQSYWPQYFATVARLLKPGGHACVQSIVIQDALFERYLQSTDFIQQYIFPGGCLPSPQEFQRQAQAHGLEVVNTLAFGADYAETLRRWRDAFMARLQEVEALGFDGRFQRIWQFYLAYCEAGFEAGDIDVMQFTLRKSL